jgi:hypothetical protein
MQKMTDALLLTWHVTRDDRYLDPLRSMAAIRIEWLEGPRAESPAPGSRPWCGRQMGFLADTLAKYRLLSGSSDFDRLLEQDAPSSTISMEDKQHREMTRALQQTAKALAINFPGRTSEVRWTDRVFAFARLFGEDMLFPRAVPDCNQRPDPRLLYASATGDRGDPLVFPLNAVRWLTPPRDIAALVTDRGPDRLTAELFHFGDRPRPMGAELYLLAPGKYAYRLIDASGQEIESKDSLSVTGARSRLRFELPPQEPCILHLHRIDPPASADPPQPAAQRASSKNGPTVGRIGNPSPRKITGKSPCLSLRCPPLRLAQHSACPGVFLAFSRFLGSCGEF